MLETKDNTKRRGASGGLWFVFYVAQHAEKVKKTAPGAG
jgi:hypothetical protein